jgi:hypothetical protein
MPTQHLLVFWFQFFACTLAVVCLVRWYLLPALAKVDIWKQFEFLMLPFLIRFVGASTLVTDVVGPAYSQNVAVMVSVLDPISFALALASIFALRARSRWAFPLLLLFITEATICSVLCVIVDGPYGMIQDLHVHWYVGTIVVPILITFQFLVLIWLVKHHKKLRAAPD